MLLQSTSSLLHCNPKNGFCLSLQGVSEDVRECIAGACGSTSSGTMEGRPSLFLTTGVFDETDWILPGAHLWKGSAQKWLQRSAGTLDVF